MSHANDAAVETLLADIGSTHDELLAIVQQVRRIAATSGSGVTESVKYGGIMFSHTQFFCGVFAYRHHVTVEFGHGYRLVDSHHQLEGNGQYRRHIKLHSLAEVKSKHLADYIKQAYALATD
ncbi:DUF1801 domain-containing protein [Serratia marcescens]|uniref:DUF1801 domain-containing protein n=1 Tax=Serratia TaxID=613 RepID=UPI00066AB1DA|nr:MULTISPECIES: DUF1801 domain-containing protein [Serratia]MBH2572494.1 DUF1801 domain-containing protein [Serratia marcescens]MBH2610239.1 DUF1801 domain-containing protein [Serratia marcescens]MBH2929404.1 DUF1801 domain-containing protein [Serratia marcescens]MBH2939926.1 DUF1801 domain-containing protein [Serratia marcescens]MBN5314013.1 DUF1801 domain-containing protein [Serratia marcescens]